MADSHYQDLARVLVSHSTQIKRGDHVLVEATDVPPEFVAVLVQEICDAGGLPVVDMKSERVLRNLLLNATEERMKLIAK